MSCRTTIQKLRSAH